MNPVEIGTGVIPVMSFSAGPEHHRGQWGPYVSGANLYALLECSWPGSGGFFPRVFKSVDGGTTWALVATAPNKSSLNGGGGADYSGGVIYYAYSTAAGAVHLITFDTATDTFGPDVNTGYVVAATGRCSVVHTSSGDVIVTGSASGTGAPGTITAGLVGGVPSVFGANAGLLCVCRGSGDKVHIFYSGDPFTEFLLHRYWSPTLGLGSESTVYDDAVDQFCWGKTGQPVYWQGKLFVPMTDALTAVWLMRADEAADTVWTNVPVSPTPAFLFGDPGLPYNYLCVMGDASRVYVVWLTFWDVLGNNRLLVAPSSDGGLTFGAAFMVYDSASYLGPDPYRLHNVSASSVSTDLLGIFFDLRACSHANYVNFLVPVALSIICDNPPDGQVGVAYSHAFPASGDTPPYTFSILAGVLPPGLSLDPLTGIVSGIPTTPGVYPFIIQVVGS